MKRTNNKIYIIHINSIVYGIIFLSILLSVIYFISKGMGTSNITIQGSGVYTQDQMKTIEAVANNVTGKINNIIAVSAIFFAVIVSSVSVFQFIKIKDFDKEFNEMIKKSKELESKFNYSNIEIKNLKNDLDKIYALKDDLEIEVAKNKLELNIYKINEKFKKSGVDYNKIVQLIDESINLANRYPGFIDNIEISKLYYKRAITLDDFEVFDQAIYMAEIALDKIKEKYEDMSITNIMERDYTEEVGMFLIDLYKKINASKYVNRVIQKMGSVVTDQINDRLLSLDFIEVKNALYIIKDDYKYYGQYFLDIFIKHYKKGFFKKLKNNKEFIILLNELKIPV